MISESAAQAGTAAPVVQAPLAGRAEKAVAVKTAVAKTVAVAAVTASVDASKTSLGSAGIMSV